MFQEPFRPENELTLRFDDDEGTFVLLEDSKKPTTADLIRVVQVLISGEPGIDVTGLGEKSGIATGKLRTLLKQGEGKHWVTQRAEHGKQQFFPIPASVSLEEPASQVIPPIPEEICEAETNAGLPSQGSLPVS